MLDFKYYGSNRPEKPGQQPLTSLQGDDARSMMRDMSANLGRVVSPQSDSIPNKPRRGPRRNIELPPVVKQYSRPLETNNKQNWRTGKNLAAFDDIGNVPQAEPSSYLEADGISVVVSETKAMISGYTGYLTTEGVVDVTGGEFDSPHFVIATITRVVSTFTIGLSEASTEPDFYDYTLSTDTEIWNVPLCEVYLDTSGPTDRAVVLKNRHLGQIILSGYTETVPDADLSPALAKPFKTLEVRPSSQGEWQMYGVNIFNLNGLQDWDVTADSAGWGVPFVEKNATGATLKWLGLDSDHSLVQKSLERCRNMLGVGDLNLLQIYGMDSASVAQLATDDICLRTAAGGETKWVDSSGVSVGYADSAGSAPFYLHFIKDHDLYENDYAPYAGWVAGRVLTAITSGGVGEGFGWKDIDDIVTNHWKQSADYTVNFGTSIGDNAVTPAKTIDLANKQLMGGNWSVAAANTFTLNNTTDAITGGTGAAVILGGLNVAKKIIVDSATAGSAAGGAIYATLGGVAGAHGAFFLRGGATQAGMFYDVATGKGAAVGRDGVAGLFGDLVSFTGPLVTLSTGTDAISASSGDIKLTGGDYYHGINQGKTITDRLGGGIDIGSTHEVDFEDLLPGDKILVRR